MNDTAKFQRGQWVILRGSLYLYRVVVGLDRRGYVIVKPNRGPDRLFRFRPSQLSVWS